MKRIVSILLAALMLAGCISVNALSEDKSNWPVLKIEVYDRQVPGFNLEDCMQLRYAQEHFGDPNQIKLEFVPVSRWEEQDILTRQLAGQTAADICITYNSALLNEYIGNEGVWKLDDLLEQYGPNIKAFLGDDLLSFGQVDVDQDGVKEQYYLPARRISVANVGMFVRGDWLEKLGMEKPTTIAEFEEYCTKALDANLGGQLTIPLDFGLYRPDPLLGVKRYTDAFVDFAQVTEEDWFAYKDNHEMLPGAKEGYRWLNKLYNFKPDGNGIIHQSFAINDDAANDRYKVLGYFGTMSQQPDQPWRTDKNYQSEMANNVPGAYWTTVNCFPNESLGGKTLHDVYPANGQSIFIPYWVPEETAINAIKYLDWMCEYENMFFLQNGVEGINYLAVNEDGIPVQVQSTDVVPDEYKMHATDVCFISNGLYYGSDEKNAAALSLAFTGYEEEAKASYVNAYTDAWTQPSFSVVIQAETDYSAMVKSKQGEFLVSVLTCKPEEFDAKFDEGIQAILNTGAAEMIEEYRAAYQAGNHRGTFPGNAE